MRRIVYLLLALVWALPVIAQDSPALSRWRLVSDTLMPKTGIVKLSKLVFVNYSFGMSAGTNGQIQKLNTAPTPDSLGWANDSCTTDLDPDQLAGDATDNDKIELSLLASGGAAVGDGPQWNGTAYVPVTPGEIVTTNLQIHGDISVFGSQRVVNHADRVDIQNVYASHAANPLMIVLPDTIRFGSDSTTAVHPAIEYVPGGWNGYRYWMALTVGDDNWEDGFIRVSNNGETWTNFKVGTDSCPEPLVTESNTIFGKSGSATHLSDCDLKIGADGNLHFWIRATDTTRNGVDTTWNAIFELQSSNGYTWSTPVVVINWRPTTRNQLMSPTFWVDTSATYKAWSIHYYDTTFGAASHTRSFITLWQSDSANGIFDSVQLVVDSTTGSTMSSDTTLSGDRFGGLMHNGERDSSIIWHIDVCEAGADEKFAFLTIKTKRGAARYYLGAGVSRDGGKTLVARREPILADSLHDLSFDVPRAYAPWDWNYIYKSTGYWVNTGNGGYIDLFYGGFGGANSPYTDPLNDSYRIGRTRLKFFEPATMQRTGILGRRNTPADSLVLTFGGFADSSSGTADIVIDSSAYGAVTTKTDYVYINFKANDAFALDSLIFRWMHTQAGTGDDAGVERDSIRTDSLTLWGPDLSSGTNACDSIWWSSGGPDTIMSWVGTHKDSVTAGWSLSSRTRTAIPLRIHKLAPAGSVFKVVMQNRFGAARSAVHVEDVEIKGRSR